MSFEKYGYEVVKNALSKDLLTYIQNICNIEVELAKQYEGTTWDLDYTSNPFTPRDVQVPQSYAYYGKPYTDALLLSLKDTMCRVTGKQLGEAYSYWREYHYGATLWEHTDRESCEFSLTLCIRREGNWEIGVIKDNKSSFCELDEGDMLVYRGCDIPHFRYPFTGIRHQQIFCHYVDLNGPNKDFYKDNRKNLGINKVTTKKYEYFGKIFLDNE